MVVATQCRAAIDGIADRERGQPTQQAPPAGHGCADRHARLLPPRPTPSRRTVPSCQTALVSTASPLEDGWSSSGREQQLYSATPMTAMTMTQSNTTARSGRSAVTCRISNTSPNDAERAHEQIADIRERGIWRRSAARRVRTSTRPAAQPPRPGSPARRRATAGVRPRGDGRRANTGPRSAAARPAAPDPRPRCGGSRSGTRTRTRARAEPARDQADRRARWQATVAERAARVPGRRLAALRAVRSPS